MLYPEIEHIQPEMQKWRRHLHQHPETAFTEFNTAEFIKQKLIDWNIEVHDGIAETGLVGIIQKGDSEKKIALRADMDALPIQEQNPFDYKSVNKGKMHACGHDGHSAMLLGAANYLAHYGAFNGTVYLIFQPAEESRGGAKAMIDAGLFERFPAQAVYGMHNFPDILTGHFAVKSGPLMASFDGFEIILQGHATHAAMPHLGNDVILAAAQIITQLQSIVSRNVNPNDPAVVSITQIHGGNTWNAIPESVMLRGTFRCFNNATQKLIMDKITQISSATAQCFSVNAQVNFNPENPGYPVTENHPNETQHALAAAQAVVGSDNIVLNPEPSLGAEDFAFMLKEKPGCYLWLGNGSSSGDCLLHNPHYDFNDDILAIGASYWVKLVEQQLAN